MQSNLLVVQNISLRITTRNCHRVKERTLDNGGQLKLFVSTIFQIIPWLYIYLILSEILLIQKNLQYSPLFIALSFPEWQFLIVFLSEIFLDCFVIYGYIYIYNQGLLIYIYITCVVNYIRWRFFNKCVIYNVQFSDFLNYHVTLLNFS